MIWNINSFEDITREKILEARDLVSAFVPATSLIQLDGVLGKLEAANPTGAFKVRGGLVYFDWLRQDRPEVDNVITATRGNHGQSVAFAAGKSGITCRIVVPKGNSPGKVSAMKKLGAEVIEQGADFAESMEFASSEAEKRNAHFVPSFDWKLVLGVSTYGYELFEDGPDLEVVYVPIGLGSGICGTLAARNALGLKTKIIGVVAERAPAYAESFAAGEYREGREIPNTIADGVACRIPNRDSLEIINRYVEDVVTIPEDEICSAMTELKRKIGKPVEGAGAIAYAAWKKDRREKAAVIVSGGNVD